MIWWINSKRIRRAWITTVTSHTIKMLAGLDEQQYDDDDKARRSDLLVEWDDSAFNT